MIVIDENVEQYWITRIAELGYDYISIKESYQGVTDQEVISPVQKLQGILITEDKDFGELVFAHGIVNVSVLLIRYDQPQYGQIEPHVIAVLKSYLEGTTSGFITITRNKVRIRKI